MNAKDSYQLVALDMDGTLLNTAHETTEYTRNALERAAKAGKVVALSTGRCLSELTEHLSAIPGIGYVIGENGACVYRASDFQMIHQVVLDDAEVAYAFEASRDLDAVCQAFIDNRSYMEGAFDESLKRYHIYHFVEVFRAGSDLVDDLPKLCRDRAGHIEKVNLYFSTKADLDTFRHRMEGRRVATADSIGLGFEISPLEATKANGLKALCGHLGIPIEQTMAVGDGGNDLDIMGAAGLSVAMANAIDEVRSRADVLTDDCDHDGAARAVEKYLLG